MKTISTEHIRPAELRAAEKEIIRIGAFLASRQYHAALAGNISFRIAEDCLVCTGHGADKGALTAEDIVLVRQDGTKISGRRNPTSEFNMHRMAYRQRPDVQAVIHAHPPAATAFAAASMPLDILQLPEMVVLLGKVALVPYATPGTEELAEKLKLYLGEHDGFLLENHGALTVGGDLAEAALRMELIEHNAQITLWVRQLGKPAFALAPAEMDSLMSIRKMMSQQKAKERAASRPDY
ncbi:MAG TPA: class II aldolase/adducin family protein [Terriglobales bacterium]|nr:class II aldolase/adducin family protein [Terriglobales bacterium]